MVLNPIVHRLYDLLSTISGIAAGFFCFHPFLTHNFFGAMKVCMLISNILMHASLSVLSILLCMPRLLHSHLFLHLQTWHSVYYFELWVPVLMCLTLPSRGRATWVDHALQYFKSHSAPHKIPTSTHLVDEGDKDKVE